MAKLVTYNNILDPLARTVSEVTANTSTELLATMNIDTDLYEVAVFRNQVLEAEPFEITNTDIIAVSVTPLGGGGGKSILMAVAMIALVVVAPYAAGAMMGMAGTSMTVGMGLAIGGLSGAMIVGANLAILYGGSMLINALLAPPAPSFDNTLLNNIASSPTYSWNVLTNQIKEGNPVPVLYGKMRVTPPQVSQYVETVDDKQYINLLYAVADGITTIDTNSIEINGESIANYTGVATYTRDGSNDQSIIGIFDDVITDSGINRKLSSTDWIYATTTGNSVSGITIGLTAPQGLWYANDSGGVSTNSVKVNIEYLYAGNWLPLGHTYIEHGTILGYWVKSTYNYYTKYSNVQDAINASRYGGTDNSIGSSSTLPSNVVVTQYTGNLLGSAEDPGNGYTYFTEYESVTTNYATISGNTQSAIRKSFTVSGLPQGQYQTRVKFYEEPANGSRYGSTLYYEYLQETVTDDFTYPNTALLGLRILATDQLSGSAPRVTVVAENVVSNPSNVCIDVLERSGEILSSKELETFTEWQDYCTQEDYTCNLYLDKQYTVRQVLNMVGILGRGNVLQYGSKWGVIMDKPDITPVQGFLFTMGNIAKDSFTEQFLPLQDRANKIALTYYDAEANWSPQILEVSSASYETSSQLNETAVNYIGCTSKDMALKYAKYSLNCNRYLTITQAFEVDTEAIVCRVGDVIKVAHDVPGIGISGRIISGTTTVVILDREVTMVVGKRYFLEFRYSDTDEIVSAEVLNTGTTTDTVSLIDTLSVPPRLHDVYSFGEVTLVTKKMRVTDITTTAEQRSKIVCIEYVDAVYDDATNVIPHSESSFNIVGLSLSEGITYAGSTSISSLDASWRGSSLSYNVYLDGNLYETVHDDKISIKNIEAPGTYEVCVTDPFGNEASGTITLLGRFTPPEAPTDFSVKQYNQILRFRWTKSIAQDVIKYEIRTGVTWDTGFRIGIVGNVNTFEWSPEMNETYRFMIKAYDASGVYSEEDTYIYYNTSGIDNYLNIILTYDGLDVNTPPCGTTTGLWFIVGRGYIPFSSIEYNDIVTTTYDDMPTQTYDEESSFESCSVDTAKLGTTKIRMFASYSTVAPDATYLTYPDRTYLTYPNATYLTIPAEAGLKFYYSISDDDTTYGPWIEYVGLVDESFRYIKFKYTFIGTKAHTISEISDFKAKLDVPDIDFTINNRQIANSATITYTDEGYDFYSAPLVSPTSKDGVSLAVIKNVTATSFDIEAYDTNGALTTATFDIRIQGY